MGGQIMENTLFGNDEKFTIQLTSEIISFLKTIAELEKGCAPSVGLMESWITNARDILVNINVKFKEKEGY